MLIAILNQLSDAELDWIIDIILEAEQQRGARLTAHELRLILRAGQP